VLRTERRRRSGAAPPATRGVTRRKRPCTQAEVRHQRAVNAAEQWTCAEPPNRNEKKKKLSTEANCETDQVEVAQVWKSHRILPFHGPNGRVPAVVTLTMYFHLQLSRSASRNLAAKPGGSGSRPTKQSAPRNLSRRAALDQHIAHFRVAHKAAREPCNNQTSSWPSVERKSESVPCDIHQDNPPETGCT